MNNKSIFIPDNIEINEMANNKLFCTFVGPDDLENTLETLIQRYTILYNKIFILESPDTEEYIMTYNIDVYNTNSLNALPCTILLHRKKQYNVLYSLNALNEIIKSCNGGVIDVRFIIDWSLYRNTILLTQDGCFKQLRTKIFNIIEL